jgi:predicted double-glycine peptidase
MMRFLPAAAAMLMTGSACAATLHLHTIGGYTMPVASMKEMRFKSTLRQQYDFSCGAAAIATLLTHQYGYPVTEQAVFQKMFEIGDQEKIRREGFSLMDMKRYLETHGFAADGFMQPLEKLASAQLPAIVLINDKGYHHFVVIKGIRDGRVLVGDPAVGTRSIARSYFESIWVNQLLFVIHNQKERARFNNPADWDAAPQARLADSIKRDGLDILALPRLGGGDF